MFSTTTPQQIKNNPSNNSSAKYHWSFSKAPRFKDPNPYSKDISNSKGSTLSTRRASIGYGTRSTFFDGKKQTIDPGLYNLNSSFQMKKGYTLKGFNFGHNRDELNFSNYLIFNEKTPGPSKYQIQETQTRGKKSYSMRPKTAYPKNYFLPNDPQTQLKGSQPGPGKYQTIDTIGSARYYNSKSKNGGNTSFIGKQRFSNIRRTPGPGDYTLNTLQPDGRSFLSTNRAPGRIALMTEKRQLRLDGNKFAPGPGTYRQPSDFGHYQKSVRPSTARH